MMSSFVKEKRKYPRIELRLAAKYKVLDYEQAFKFTETRNISAEGLCFESEECLKPGVFVQLDVDLEDANHPVSMVAEIRWVCEVKPDKERQYLNGVKIISMHGVDEARFLKYYCNKLTEKLSHYLE